MVTCLIPASVAEAVLKQRWKFFLLILQLGEGETDCTECWKADRWRDGSVSFPLFAFQKICSNAERDHDAHFVLRGEDVGEKWLRVFWKEKQKTGR